MSEWKCGNEFLPYHPQASHVHPDYRDGWNACYKAAGESRAQQVRASAGESRKQFEEWARTVGLDLGLVEDSYFSSFTYYASIAWEASRALALEQAAKACDQQAEDHEVFRNAQAVVACDGCADAIRSLLDKEAPR